MKKKTLVQRLYEEHSDRYSKKKVYSMVNFLISRMRDALVSGEGLKVWGFGSFRKRGKRILFRPSKKVLQKLKSEVRRAKIYF
ncbi:MAG: HU family DNA-binding protein [Aquificaceae bacterium]|nr:HU family DNA-binding protein [Aquificaceae bacterium]MDW8032240.1 HU family DNA-binding protein [Aquificaceae bacterium]MDW8293866.1 HU family DNA-binding protein [Aquificaceae bacterium]